MSDNQYVFLATQRYPSENETGAADLLVVNSRYTASIFIDTFPEIMRNPRVIHPGIDLKKYTQPDFTSTSVMELSKILG